MLAPEALAEGQAVAFEPSVHQSDVGLTGPDGDQGMIALGRHHHLEAGTLQVGGHGSGPEGMYHDHPGPDLGP